MRSTVDCDEAFSPVHGDVGHVSFTLSVDYSSIARGPAVACAPGKGMQPLLFAQREPDEDWEEDWDEEELGDEEEETEEDWDEDEEDEDYDDESDDEDDWDEDSTDYDDEDEEDWDEDDDEE